MTASFPAPSRSDASIRGWRRSSTPFYRCALSTNHRCRGASTPMLHAAVHEIGRERQLGRLVDVNEQGVVEQQIWRSLSGGWGSSHASLGIR
jgi:hypothetical protein